MSARATRSLRLIDRPAAVERAAYDRALGDATRLLQAQPGIAAVYQIGGVSAPGISDLDMVAVFEDDAVCTARPSAAVRAACPYLYIHNLYGASRSHFERAQSLSFFHNYRLLAGDDARTGTDALSPEATAHLKRQIALEYLVKLYVAVELQRAYGALQVRSFLLHVKAVLYDLDFLDVHDGEFRDRTERFVGWRNVWFEAPPSSADYAAAFEAYGRALAAFLAEQVQQHPFYLPGPAPYRVARNLWLRPGRALTSRRRGVRLPAALARLGKRYVRLSNRLNRFDFTVPAASGPPPPALAERFALVRAMDAHNRVALPGFDPLTSSL